MMRATIITVWVLTMAMATAAVYAASAYPLKPDEPNAVMLTKQAFPDLHADGVGDDTAVLQRAIDQASASRSLLRLVPEGRYRISRTLGVPPSTRLIGFGAKRPTFVLGENTAGFDSDPPKYMVWFSGGGR